MTLNPHVHCSVGIGAAARAAKRAESGAGAGIAGLLLRAHPRTALRAAARAPDAGGRHAPRECGRNLVPKKVA